MKKLFRKLFGIKYHYHVVREMSHGNDCYRVSGIVLSQVPVTRDVWDQFLDQLEAHDRKNKPEFSEYDHTVMSISRL